MAKIKVTEDHIKRGRKGNCRCCPIALAIAEATVDCRVLVGVKRVKIGKHICPLPEEVTEFIDAYDYGDPVQPFEFEL